MNWLWLALGYIYYVYRRATLVAKSSSSPMTTRVQWIVRNRGALMIHGLLVGALYLLILEAPTLIGPMLGAPNLKIPAALFHPVTLILAGFFGTAVVDSQLERFPRFKSEVPQIKDEPTVTVSSFKESEK